MKNKKTFENMFVPKAFKVLEFFRETPDVYTLKIDMKIKHDPGQFVMISALGIGEVPISICSYSDKYIKLNIREVGNVTRALSKLRKGDYVLIRGPYGKGYPMEGLKGNSLVIIGGGCGVAPLKGVIDYLDVNRQDYKDITIFLGYQRPNEIIFKREIKEWKRKYELQITIDKIPRGEACYDLREGFITEAVKDAGIGNKNRIVFICGPPIMIKYVVEILKNKGLKDQQIYISAERLMYCGVGVCCHCMIREKFTCKDGPVFRYDEIKGVKDGQ